MSYTAGNTTIRPIYGMPSIQKPCVYTVPKELNVVTYINQLNTTMTALKTFNNKNAALENNQFIKNNINIAISNASTP